MKVLVTGAGGFVGRNLADHFAREHDVAAPGRADVDLLDEDAVCRYLRTNAFDVVVHSATVRANRKSGAPPHLLRDNLRMFCNLARNADAFGRMLFLSSGAVYDRRYPAPLVCEEQFGQHVPADDYGFSKYLCGQLIESAANIWDLRLFGVFGPHEDWEIRFVSNACCRAMYDLPVVIRRNVFFDYLDVADLAEMVRWFLDAQPRYRAYNLCRGQAIDLATLAHSVVRASGKDLPVAIKEEGLGDEYSGSNQRLTSELPFSFRTVDDSIRNLYEWYLERRNTIDAGRLHFDA